MLNIKSIQSSTQSDGSLNEVFDYGQCAYRNMSIFQPLSHTNTKAFLCRCNAVMQKKSRKLKATTHKSTWGKKWSPKAPPEAPPSSCPSQSESKPHHSCPPPFQHSERNRHNSALNNTLTAVENGRSQFGCFSAQSHYITPYPCALESSFPEDDGE